MFIDPDGRTGISTLGWILIGVGIYLLVTAVIAAIAGFVNDWERNFFQHWGSALLIVGVIALTIGAVFFIVALLFVSFTDTDTGDFTVRGVWDWVSGLWSGLFGSTPLGELGVWRDAETTIIGRWGENATDIPRRIYVRNVGTNNLNLVDAMTFAVNAWNEALDIPGHMYLVPFTGNSPPAGASIWFVGGTVNQLLTVRSSLLPDFRANFISGHDRLDANGNPQPYAGAVSIQNNSRSEGNWTYVSTNGSRVQKRGRTLRAGVHGFIRARDQGSLTNDQLRNLYRNVAIHELAHALGWWGHSNYTLDIMYRRNINNTWPNARQNLTRQEINHLRQVYGLTLR